MPFEDLERARFAALKTFRKDGAAVTTPVWVAVAGGRAYVVSRGPGKVRRIRHTPAVEIAPCTARGGPKGSFTPGHASLLAGDLPPDARRAFRRKYGPLPALGRALAGLVRKPLVGIVIDAA